MAGSLCLHTSTHVHASLHFSALNPQTLSVFTQFICYERIKYKICNNEFLYLLLILLNAVTILITNRFLYAPPYNDLHADVKRTGKMITNQKG